jgi:hypothetical protein
MHPHDLLLPCPAMLCLGSGPMASLMPPRQSPPLVRSCKVLSIYEYFRAHPREVWTDRQLAFARPLALGNIAGPEDCGAYSDVCAAQFNL